jgi:transposase
MPRLTLQERWQAAGMLFSGMATREIARHFNCDQSTIVRLHQRFLATGTTNDRARPGQPRVTTLAQDRHILLMHRRNRFQTATQTAAHTRGTRGLISANTVRRRLHSSGLQNRSPNIGPILTRRHRTNRLAWAQQNIHRPRAEWRSTMFSDESRFNVSFADRRNRVWRRPGERYADVCIVQHNRYGGGSVHVWGGFSYEHRTPLHVFTVNVTADVYVNQVLRPIVVPFFHNHQDVGIFQHDNARPHTANVTRNFLAQQPFLVLDWPANSPDMNPVEHAWDELNRRVRQYDINNVNDLERALIAEWNAIPQTCFETLCNSMRRRCQACIDAAGGHTRY